eukprot:UC4_evm4s524
MRCLIPNILFSFNFKTNGGEQMPGNRINVANRSYFKAIAISRHITKFSDI